MDGDVLSLSSSSSISSSAAAAAETQKDTSPKSDISLPQSQQEHKSAEELWYVPCVHVFFDIKTAMKNIKLFYHSQCQILSEIKINSYLTKCQ